jgi:hypothetical protein
MKIGAYPVALMVDTGNTHLVVTHPIGPLSQRHATIVGPQGIRLTAPSLYLENAILESIK